MQLQGRSDSDGFSDSLERRLRDLPQLPIPVDLEARLLAAIPVKEKSNTRHPVRDTRRRPILMVGGGIAFATACLLLLILWPNSGDNGAVHRVVVNLDKNVITFPFAPERKYETLSIVTKLEVRRRLMGNEKQFFTWPVRETSPLMVSSEIPRDLLD